MGVAGMSGFRRIWRLTPRVGAIAAGACYRRGCGPDWPAEWVACWRRLVSRAAREPRMGRGRSRPRRRSRSAVSRCGGGTMPAVAFSPSAPSAEACNGRVRFGRTDGSSARAVGPLSVAEPRLPETDPRRSSQGQHRRRWRSGCPPQPRHRGRCGWPLEPQCSAIPSGTHARTMARNFRPPHSV